MLALNLYSPTRSKPQFLQKPQPTHHPNPEMAIRVPLLHPKLLPHRPKFPSYPFPSPSILPPRNTKSPKISCLNSLNDADLASDFAMEVEKMHTHQVQREEAMKKSRELLFGEICKYLGLKSEELKMKWKSMEEDEKWDCIKGFVSDWGENFHPLSVRSVKDMVEEHLDEENLPPDSSPSVLFPGLQKFWFS